MDVIRRQQQPPVRRPVAVIAFGGWNDACDVASNSANYLIDAHETATLFAEVEPDPFYDFQQHRPTVDIRGGVTQGIGWPTVTFTALSRPRDDRDLIVVTGPEPNFAWKTFSRSLVEELADLGVEDVVLVGAYVGAVDHRQPVELTGVGTDSVSVVRSGLDSSNYSGPTGIVGIVQGACKEAGIRALSIWAATPAYLSGNPYPKGVLAIVEKISEVARLHIDTSELIAIDAEYTERVDTALEEAGTDVAEFLEEIEHYDEPILGSLTSIIERGDRQPPRLDPDHADELVDEIVRFLEGDA
ncbi:MAG: PAC2 family protein [Acidimicrobiia bacterium]|nr:PAC2 family protein [Acidimicrobiia bacterium]